MLPFSPTCQMPRGVDTARVRKSSTQRPNALKSYIPSESVYFNCKIAKRKNVTLDNRCPLPIIGSIIASLVNLTDSDWYGKM